MDWEPGTVYLKHFDKDGKCYIAEHNCWHMSNFVESQQAAALKAVGHIERATKEEFESSKRQR